MTAERYDAIVIGAGQSGGPLTSALTEHGYKTALIERAKVGGTCVNWGCTPTKTMIASARVAHMVGRSGDYGVNNGSAGVDMRAIRQRKRDITNMFHEGTRDAIVSTEGLDLLMGEACFTGEKTVCVDMVDGEERHLSAEWFFIDTGTSPSAPPFPGLESVTWHDSTSIMELGEVPGHLLIVGGGYVGLEFAQMFRRFGAEVTVIQRGSQLLTREDRDVADTVRGILEDDGVDVRLDTSVQSVGGDDDSGIRVYAENGNSEISFTGTHLLLAAGRKPNTDTLNAAATGLELDDKGFIPVNDRLETSVDGIWAMGDVTGGPAFTHISYDDYRILTANLFGAGGASTSGRVVPYVVFIDPELGRVGLTENEARDAGHRIQVASMEMTGVARAIEMAETRGMMKAVVNAETGRILGAAVLGINGGEIMSILQLAMITGTPYTTLRDAPFAHPTVAESLNNLFSSVE